MKPIAYIAAACFITLASCQKKATKTCTACATPQAFPGQTGTAKVANIAGHQIHYYQINGQAVWEGDIILTDAQLGTLKTPNLHGAAILGKRWPGGIVYYMIDRRLPNQSRVTDAMKNWEAHSNVRFEQATDSTANYVFFTTGGGCSSNIGMTGGRQDTHLARGCSVGNTVHEIGHDLGLFHEISRADRDSTITIIWANIESGYAANFQTYIQNGDAGFDNGPFDFQSVMMYDQYSFSKNGMPTITKKDGSGYEMQYGTLSPGDIQIINKMYPSAAAKSAFNEISGIDRTRDRRHINND